MNILEINGLNKSFGKKTVINNFNLSLPKGAVLGFVGKNGAGKTTIMRMILGFLKRDAGDIKISGEPVQFGENTTNRLIGYLPDVPEFYNYLNAKEYLKLCGKISELNNNDLNKRVDELLALVGLKDKHQRIKGYSRGMKQRLGIAQALLTYPKILICDEPTSALDPIGRKEILNILSKLKGQTTVIFSTHILSDIEAACDHIVILDQGRDVLYGKIADIKEKYANRKIEIQFQNSQDQQKFLENHNYREIPVNVAHGIVAFPYIKDKISDKVLLELVHLGLFPKKIQLKEMSLEDIFMEVTTS